MSNKSPSPKFAQTIPIGGIVIICGIGAVNVLSQNLIIACLVGMIGIVVGIAAFRMQVEKLDKIFAVIGMALSLFPMIYAIVIII